MQISFVVAQMSLPQSKHSSPRHMPTLLLEPDVREELWPLRLEEPPTHSMHGRSAMVAHVSPSPEQ